jgi:competence protein ComEC
MTRTLGKAEPLPRGEPLEPHVRSTSPRSLHRLALGVALFADVACDRDATRQTAGGSIAPTVPGVVINEIMANPRTLPDARGEWIELRNLEARAIDLRSWTIASANDRGTTIDRSVVLGPNGIVVLARDADPSHGGAYVYGAGVALGNGADWIAIRLPDGRTVDSVAWTSAISGASRALRDAAAPRADVAGAAWVTSSRAFGRGDFGSPGQPNGGAVTTAPGRAAPTTPAPATSSERLTSRTGPPAPAPASRDSTLAIRILDVGQGDAILIENGGSRVLIDGGPDPTRFGRLLEQMGIDGGAVDAVILTHQHYDHYAGLRELFRTRRRIAVRHVFENKDPASSTSLAQLRDSIIARATRGDLDYRDTDDPCGTGAPACSITMRGGARLHILRPDPQGDGPNNRSVAVRLVAPDSSRFSMWLAGDAEQQAIRWFDATDYDRAPGMGATVLKGDHHGSCDGISPRYLDLVRPRLVVMSLAAANDYGYVHRQTLDLLRNRRIPWYRTDQNGTITITVPPRGSYAVTVERGSASMRGPSDRTARDCGEGDDRRLR